MRWRTVGSRWRNNLPFWTLLAIVVFGNGCGKQGNSVEPATEYFCLAFGVATNNELAELDVLIGGGSLGGQVDVFINGIPVRCVRGGGFLESINEWLIDGKNEIRIEGQHRETLSVKVLRADRKEYETTGKFKELLAEARISPSDKSHPITFHVDLPWSAVSPDQLEADAGSREQGAREIEQAVENLRVGMTSKHGSDWADSFLAGMRHYGDSYGGMPDSALKEIKKELVAEFGGATVPASESKAIQLLWGTRGVLAFSDFDQFDRPFSIRLERDKKTLRVRPLVFVRKNQQWEIWNRP